jgi:nucleoid-associated protein YgaU
MKNLIRSFGPMVLASSLLVVVGCGKSVTREANVSEGDYYDAEEFKDLSGDQRDAYCADLDAELARLQNETSETSSQAEASSAQLAQAQREVKAAEDEYTAKKSETDALQEEIDYYENLPKVHVVEKGEFLQKISGYERIYADPTKWTRIYFANKPMFADTEYNPNLIYPGWELTIPRDWPSTWTVRQDEYLAKIAGYWEIYDDRTAWTKIYEANKDQISDPDMIWPGWELSIPRD